MNTIELNKKNVHDLADEIFETKRGYHHYTELCKGRYKNNKGVCCAVGYMIERFVGPAYDFGQCSLTRKLARADFRFDQTRFDSPIPAIDHELSILIQTNDRADNYFDRARKVSKLIHELADKLP